MIDFEQIQQWHSETRHRYCNQSLLCSIPMDIDLLFQKDSTQKGTKNLWIMKHVDNTPLR